MTDIDSWLAAGLYDPDAPHAEDRRALLEFLVSQGATLDEMVRYAELGWLTSTAADRLLDPGGTYTAADAAERAGIPIEVLEHAYQIAGLAVPDRDQYAWGEDDVALMTAFGAAIELFGTEAMLQFARVLGASLARIAEMAVASFLINVEGPLRERAPKGDLELAQSNTLAVQMLLAVPELCAPLFRRHAAAAQRRTRTSRASAYDMFDLAVCFVDLVGYTELSARLSPADLAAAVDDFEREAVTVIARHGGRLVKSIGDEMMFVTASAADAASAARELVARVHEHAVLTELRGAVAFGGLLGRDGDYYGPVVNRAARLVKHAAPATLVSDAPVTGFESRSCGEVELRGIAEPVELFEIS